MPLIQSGSCEALFKNRAKLIKEGRDKKQATRIAAEISRKNGGDPSKCLGGGPGKEEKKD